MFNIVIVSIWFGVHRHAIELDYRSIFDTHDVMHIRWLRSYSGGRRNGDSLLVAPS